MVQKIQSEKSRGGFLGTTKAVFAEAQAWHQEQASFRVASHSFAAEEGELKNSKRKREMCSAMARNKKQRGGGREDDYSRETSVEGGGARGTKIYSGKKTRCEGTKKRRKTQTLWLEKEKH